MSLHNIAVMYIFIICVSFKYNFIITMKKYKFIYIKHFLANSMQSHSHKYTHKYEKTQVHTRPIDSFLARICSACAGSTRVNVIPGGSVNPSI